MCQPRSRKYGVVSSEKNDQGGQQTHKQGVVAGERGCRGEQHGERDDAEQATGNEPSLQNRRRLDVEPCDKCADQQFEEARGREEIALLIM